MVWCPPFPPTRVTIILRSTPGVLLYLLKNHRRAFNKLIFLSTVCLARPHNFLASTASFNIALLYSSFETRIWLRHEHQYLAFSFPNSHGRPQQHSTHLSHIASALLQGSSISLRRQIEVHNKGAPSPHNLKATFASESPEYHLPTAISPNPSSPPSSPAAMSLKRPQHPPPPSSTSALSTRPSPSSATTISTPSNSCNASATKVSAKNKPQP